MLVGIRFRGLVENREGARSPAAAARARPARRPGPASGRIGRGRPSRCVRRATWINTSSSAARAQHNLKNVSCRAPARPAGGHHRAERLGQVVARVRHDLRRGPAPLRRVALGLRAAVPRAAAEARRREHRGPVPGHRHRAAGARQEPALDRRHRHRDRRLPAPAVRARRRPALPEVRQALRGADRPADRRPHPRAAARAPRLSVLAPDRARAQGRARSSSSSGCAAKASCARASTAQIVDLGDDHRARPQRSRTTSTSSSTASSCKEGVKGRLTDSRRARAQARRGHAARGAPEGERAVLVMSERFACCDCGISLPPIEPRMFSFNGPHGACPACDGLGARTRVDPERVVARSRALAARGRRRSRGAAAARSRSRPRSHAPSSALGVDPDVAVGEAAGRAAQAPSCTARRRPRRKAPGAQRGSYDGIVPRLERMLETGDARRRRRRGRARRGRGRDRRRRDSAASSSRARAPPATAAAAPRGARRAARRARTSPSSARMPLADAARVLGRRSADDRERAHAAASAPIAEPLLRAVTARLGFLIDVGLDYLSLDRSRADALGRRRPAHPPRDADRRGARRRALRARRAVVGLHARDNARLLEALRRLRRPRQHRVRRRARSRGDPRGRSRRRHGPRRGRARRDDRRRRARPPS